MKPDIKLAFGELPQPVLCIHARACVNALDLALANLRHGNLFLAGRLVMDADSHANKIVNDSIFYRATSLVTAVIDAGRETGRT